MKVYLLEAVDPEERKLRLRRLVDYGRRHWRHAAKTVGPVHVVHDYRARKALNIAAKHSTTGEERERHKRYLKDLRSRYRSNLQKHADSWSKWKAAMDRSIADVDRQ